MTAVRKLKFTFSFGLRWELGSSLVPSWQKRTFWELCLNSEILDYIWIIADMFIKRFFIVTVLRTEKILLTPFLSIPPTSLYLKPQADFYPIFPFIIILLIYNNLCKLTTILRKSGKVYWEKFYISSIIFLIIWLSNFEYNLV